MTRAHPVLTLVACPLFLAAAALAQPVGLNVLLNQPLTPALLADLDARAQVLDQIPQINAVTLRAETSQLAAIRALPYVAAAEEDSECSPASAAPRARLTGGTDAWNLDAINISETGIGRTIAYDGQGVYIAVLDSGLPSNWRDYFPEERIASQFARGFGGGGGTRGTVAVIPEAWQHSTNGHGTWVTSVLLGFRYHGPSPAFPETFDGVAPAATIIPVKVADNFAGWFSQVARAFVYLGDLKRSGALGSSPLVINMSMGGFRSDPVMAAAIDYAIGSGAVVVVAAGNEASSGMRFPGMYPPVISAGATGWVGQFPTDDPTTFEWCVRDVPEGGIAALCRAVLRV
jgi:subtilisin family serine protease